MPRMGKKRRLWLRRLVWVLGGTLALLVAAYAYMTDPGRLRARVLETLPIEGVQIAAVDFAPWRGLRIRDLVVEGGQPSAAGAPADRSLPSVWVGQVQIECDLLGLLRGRFEPRSVTVDRATLTLVCDAAAANEAEFSDSLDAGARRLWRVLHACSDRLPAARVGQLDLQVVVNEGGAHRLVERTFMRARGEITPDGYHLRVDRLPAGPVALAELYWNAAQGRAQATLDWIPVESLKQVLPPRFVNALEQARLRGRVRIDNLALQTAPVANTTAAPATPDEPSVRLADAQIRLDELRWVIPVEDDAPTAPSSAAFLQVTGATAAITCHRATPAAPLQLAVQGHGRLHGAPMEFSLDARAAALGQWAAGTQNGAGTPAPQSFLDDILQAELRVESLEIPTEATFPAFLNSSRLPSSVDAAFRDYRPYGNIDLHVRCLPTETAGTDATARLQADITARGAGCTYFHFPYAFDQATGHLRLTNGQLVFDDLCGRHGSTWACVSGVVYSTQSWSGFELEFRGVNVPLDADLHAALPPEYRQLWQSARPLGLCDVVASVRRDDGTPETGPLQPHVDVDARLLGGSVALEGNRRLTQATGRLSVRGTTVEVHDLHGYEGDAEVHLSGRLWADADGAQSDLRVEVAGLPLEEDAVLKAETATVAPPVRFAGHADAWGRIWGSEDAGRRHQHFAVQIKRGELQTADPARRWTDCTGWVVVHDERREIAAFSCQQGKARFSAAGTVPMASDPGAPLSLDLRAQGGALEELLPQFVPIDWSALTEALGLAGAGDVTVRLYPRDGDPTGVQAADITINAARMQAQPLPLGLEDVVADVTLTGRDFEVRSATARCGEHGTIRAGGKGTWQDDGLQCDLHLTAEHLLFSPGLVAALPEPVAHLLEALAVTGEFDAMLTRVRLLQGPQNNWLFQGDLPLRDADLHLGLELTGISGKLSGQCAVDNNGEVLLDAAFHVDRGAIDGRTLTNWYGTLTRRPGDRWVCLDDLRGRLCDGKALGAVRIDPQTGEYELALTLDEVSVAQLFPPPDSPPRQERRGWLSGTMHLRGRGAETGSRRGGGDIRIRGASFLHTPVLASVSEARPQDGKHISDAVDEVTIRFLWEGTRLRMQRVDIKSHDLRLLGEGHWDLQSDVIDMTLWGTHPDNVPLGEFLESAGKALVQYRVQGTLAAPKVTTEPLHRLNETFRALQGETN